jgi:uncharacterized protein
VSIVELVLIVAAGAALAGFIQGLTGFGFALTAMALWAWTLEPRLAAVLAVFGGMTGQIIAAVRVRRGWDWQRLWPFVAGGLAGVPLGVLLLPGLDVTTFKGLLGLFIVIVCPLMFVAPRLPRLTVGGRFADALSGMGGGFMGGVGGFAGVVPTLWCTLRGLGKDEQRSIIQNFNLTMLTVTFASYLATGLVEWRAAMLFAVVVPAMIIPSLLGARVYLGMSDTAFRRAVLGLLTLSGAAMLVSAAPTLLGRIAGS